MAKPYIAEKKAYKKAKRKFVSLWKTVGIICLVLTLILAPLNIVLGMFDNTISLLVPGNSFWELENKDASAIYYPGMGVSQEERLEAGQALCYQVEAEGAALLLNKNFRRFVRMLRKGPPPQEKAMARREAKEAEQAAKENAA